MTLAEVAALALQTMGIYAGGETPSSADSLFVQAALTRKLAELATPAVGIAVWTIDNTPDEYADAFIQFAASAFAPTFGLQVGDDTRQRGLARLRELTGDARVGSGAAVYF